MSIQITITEKEILDNPNDFSLGELVRNKYWQERRNSEFADGMIDDEQFFLNIGEDGQVKSIGKPWTCCYCGKPTNEVDSDYLVGWDHLSCKLEEETRKDEYDKCVICGKETPYKRSTHIDYRIGYVEGGGQGCYQSHICDKN